MRSPHFFRWISAVLLTFAILAGGVPSAAGTTGNLSGTVVNAATGAPIAGAKITVTSPSDSRTAVTDASGGFAFLSLAPDTYVVSVEKPGFDELSNSGISVFADQTQRLSLRLDKPLRTVARVTTRSSTDLVRPGTTTDSYSVNASVQSAAAGLGGGGSLNQAYSALATVPGVNVPAGQNGWSQTAGVTIRGGTHTQVGYEFDGVPTNVGINFFPGSGLSTLGQQELQVYTGSAPVNAESQGLSGFVNQVIKTGTSPGFVDGDLAIGNPFYHKAAFEFGGTTTNRNFSYYVGFLGANQSFRDVDQYNGASYTKTYGTAFAALPCPHNATDLNFASCYEAFTPEGLGTGPGGFAYAPPNYGNAAYEEDRENVVNLHLALPHKGGSLKDDLQFLYDEGGISTYLYSSQNDLPAADLAVVGGAYTYPNGYVYNGALGQALPSNYASLVKTYYFPTEDTSALGNGGFVPADRRDEQENFQSIEKVQYQHNISDTSYFKAYAYALYANFLLSGANGASSPLGIGEPGDYKLWTHTTGEATEYANQLSASHLFTADASFTHSPSVRDNSNPFYTSPGTAFATAVNSSDPTSGICYAVTGLVATPASCEPGGGASAVTYKNVLSPAANPITSLSGVTCGSGPCEYYVDENGQRGTINQVVENTVSASIRDQWRPSEKLSIDYGLKFHEYLYTGADTTGGTRDFWFNAYNTDYCVNAVPGNTPVTKSSLGLGVTSACSLANTSASSYIAPTLTNAPSNYAYPEFEPRLGATYTLDRNDVLRASLGKYTQSAESGFEQYNTLQQNLPAYLGSEFYKFSLETPGHNIKPQESYNYDFSLEHAFKGTDIAFKVTPFYRTTNNELTEFFINPATQVTSGLAVGSLRADGLEFQIKKGSFDRNGFAAQLSYTYTDARIKYSTLPNGGNIISPINVDIQTYNAYTSYCSSHPTDKRCGATSTGGKAAACFTSAGSPDPSCAAGDIANPYWNAPVQNLLSPTASYWPTDPVVATTGLGVNSYTVPQIATLLLNYRAGRFAITPSVQFQGGQRYGAPESNAGIDPASGCAPLAGSTTGDPRYPYGSSGGSPYDALTCAGALNAIPDVFTKKFDAIGAFTSPSQLLGSVNVSYDATKNIGFTMTVSNLFNQCFGGSTEPWTGNGGPRVCSYVNGEVSRAYVPTGNVYNPGATFEPYARYPYDPYLGPYTMGVVSPSSPLTISVNMHVKL